MPYTYHCKLKSRLARNVAAFQSLRRLMNASQTP